jgi:uncharacterized sulfatase
MPSVIPAGVINRHPAASVDIFPTICDLVGVPIPDDRVIDGRDIMPMFKDSSESGPHDAIYCMQGTNLATIRSGKWKLHVIDPELPRFSDLSEEEKRAWKDPRGPDGVTLLAPFEQSVQRR